MVFSKFSRNSSVEPGNRNLLLKSLIGGHRIDDATPWCLHHLYCAGECTRQDAL